MASGHERTKYPTSVVTIIEYSAFYGFFFDSSRDAKNQIRPQSQS